MAGSCDYRPSASIDTLRLRARLLAAARRFFDERGYWEVDTPLASHERAVDPHLAPFVVLPADLPRGDHTAAARTAPLYLQTSPEFAMKRLLAAGANAIYQLGHVFREGERGRLHNPEFTMLEWYRVGDTHLEQMQLVEEFVLAMLSSGRSGRAVAGPFRRTTYREAFLQATGVDVLRLNAAELEGVARSRRVPAPEGLGGDRDAWLNLLLAELVEPALGRERPEFLYDYPSTQAALARVRPGDPPVAERFELYIEGVEICNGYHELTDAEELRRRIERESVRRLALGLDSLQIPERLAAALEAGLPGCAGVAPGFDRLMMFAAGARTIDEVLPFTIEQA